MNVPNHPEAAAGRPRLHIVGAGPGDAALWTARARQLVQSADRLLVPHRLVPAARAVNPAARALGVDEMRAALTQEARDTVLLVSGDAGFFSLSRSLGEQFGAAYDVELHPGVSSLSYFCARRGVAWDDALCLSTHGRAGGRARVLGAVCYHPKVFVLTGPGDVLPLLRELHELGAPLRVSVGERLSEADERITCGAPGELPGPFADPAVLLVENSNPTDPHRRLRDGDFQRGAVPMTKEAVRTLAAARLAVCPRDTVWDIGAGTGSVSVALAHRAREGLVYALERNPEALELIRANRAALGAYNVRPVAGAAPEALEQLPTPDAVFVGGGGAAVPGVLRAALQRNPAVRVCVTAIALETLQRATQALDELGFHDIEVECVQVSRAQHTGGLRLMKALNPVYLLSGRGEA